MIDFLANTIGKWQLNKAVRKQNRLPQEQRFSDMKSAIILFTVSTADQYQQILEVVNALKRDENFTKVDVLGYFPGKEVPSFIDDQLVQCMLSANVGLTGIPKLGFVQEMISGNYDVLLDFSEGQSVPMEYVLALVNAKTKVGNALPEKEYVLDLIIDIKKDSSILDLSKNMIRYLKMVHP